MNTDNDDSQERRLAEEEERSEQDSFWDAMCKKEPAHPGCRLYDL